MVISHQVMTKTTNKILKIEAVCQTQENFNLDRIKREKLDGFRGRVYTNIPSQNADATILWIYNINNQCIVSMDYGF